jgi:uncharacterized membrane protein YkgB
MSPWGRRRVVLAALGGLAVVLAIAAFLSFFATLPESHVTGRVVWQY